MRTSFTPFVTRTESVTFDHVLVVRFVLCCNWNPVTEDGQATASWAFEDKRLSIGGTNKSGANANITGVVPPFTPAMIPRNPFVEQATVRRSDAGRLFDVQFWPKFVVV